MFKPAHCRSAIWMWGAAAMAATCATAVGCGDQQRGPGDDDLTSVQVAITAAPSSAACLRVTFTVGSQVTRETVAVTAGQRTVMQFDNLAVGTGTVSGEAFSTPCSALTATTLSDWVAPAVPVTITTGVTVVANLVFTRGGQVVVSADFPASPLLARQAAVGRSHTCAILSDQTTRCWGSNQLGQIGDGGPATSRLRPVVVSRTPALELALGDMFSCELLADATVNCWGVAVRNGSAAQQVFPAPVVGLSSVAHLAAGDNHSCALLLDGTVRCWGENTTGQLGNGTLVNSATPVNPNLKGIVQLSEAGGASYALGGDGTVWAWGDNLVGELGDGTTTSRSTPRRIPGLTNVVQISAGLNHACARIADATLKCWGVDNLGQVGDGVASATPRLVPTQANVLVSTEVAAGQDFTLTISSNGLGSGWGANNSATFGNGTQTSSLISTSAGGNNVFAHFATSSGGSTACGVTLDGRLLCWGSNLSGNVGDGTTTLRLTPFTLLF